MSPFVGLSILEAAILFPHGVQLLPRLAAVGGPPGTGSRPFGAFSGPLGSLDSRFGAFDGSLGHSVPFLLTVQAGFRSAACRKAV